MKPPTVFLGELTNPELEAFLQKDHTVIVPDLRGMGLSARPSGGYDKKTQARENGLWQYLSTAVGNRDPGSFTILTEQYFLQYQDLILTGAEDIAVQGTGDLIVFDLPSVSGDIATTGRGN